jgi:transposase InsO family protein
VARWSDRTELPAKSFTGWLGLGASKFFSWKRRYGKANEHNGQVPRDHWLTAEETRAIETFAREYLTDGYRRITYMMMDANIVAVSPASVFRVLKRAGLLNRWNGTPSKKGSGFTQPVQPHEHWHIDIAYLNICGTFYYLITVLDGCSRYVIHWDLRESMKERDVEIVLQRARELFPEARPRIISDNGPQFVAKDFKEFIRIAGMTHVRTSPYHPQSNGKLERFHHTIKSEGIRPETPLTPDDGRDSAARFIRRYNTERLHSGIGYVTPLARLEGRHKLIHADRDRKIEEARSRRARLRALARRAEPELQSGANTDSISR